MFDWLKKYRVEKLANNAKQYVENHFVEPKEEDALKPNTIDVSHVQFSMRRKDSCESDLHKTSDNGAKYSMRDKYDSGTIQRTMRNIYDLNDINDVLYQLQQKTIGR